MTRLGLSGILLSILLVLGMLYHSYYGDAKYDEGFKSAGDIAERKYLEDMAKVKQANEALYEFMQEKEDKQMKELFDVQENADNYIAELNAGTKRLRAQLSKSKRCMPKDESDTTSSQRESTGELSKDVGERLTRRRESCDKLAVKFNMCVDYVKDNYKHINGLEKLND